jgi:methyl-accepting chemotaxis protein
MSHFNDRPGLKLTITAAITVVVVVGMIDEKGWLAVESLAGHHDSVEMASLFVGLLVVGMLFGWALYSGFSMARSIHRTGDVLLHRGDNNEAVDNPDVCDELADDVQAAKTPCDNLLRIEHTKAEHKEALPPGIVKLADQFQAAVGTLIGTGSPALTEREPSAGTFTETAESTHTGMAANHSDASASDCSVGNGPVEMASSANEIAGPARSNIAREVMTQAAGRVDDALKSIPAIAERINPPALRAVIAAVRAGEAGKGFAVVARELTVLAAQTAKAIEQLGVHTGETQATTHDPSSASGTSRQASGAPERASRRSQPRGKNRARDAGDRPERPTPRPRRRRSGLT